MTRDPSLPLRRSLSQTPHTRSRAALQAAAQREHALSGLLQDLRRGALQSIIMAASMGVSETTSNPRATNATRAAEARTHCSPNSYGPTFDITSGRMRTCAPSVSESSR